LTSNAPVPPDPHLFVCHRRSFHPLYSATKQHLLEIRGPTIDFTPRSVPRGPLIAPRTPTGRVRRSSLAIHGTPPPVPFTPVVHLIARELPTRIRDGDSSPTRAHSRMGCDRDSRTGCCNLGSLSGVSFDLFSPLPPSLFHMGFGSVVHFSSSVPHFSPPCHYISHFLQSSSFAFLCYLSYISSALPLCTYLCRFIACTRYFINYGTSSLLSVHASNLFFRHRAAPLHMKRFVSSL
jgi:hypothetical protein